jgi:hypothetical protein
MMYAARKEATGNYNVKEKANKDNGAVLLLALINLQTLEAIK